MIAMGSKQESPEKKEHWGLLQFCLIFDLLAAEMTDGWWFAFGGVCILYKLARGVVDTGDRSKGAQELYRGMYRSGNAPLARATGFFAG